jgi:hypothetical protein
MLTTSTRGDQEAEQGRIEQRTIKTVEGKGRADPPMNKAGKGEQLTGV